MAAEERARDARRGDARRGDARPAQDNFLRFIEAQSRARRGFWFLRLIAPELRQRAQYLRSLAAGVSRQCDGEHRPPASGAGSGDRAANGPPGGRDDG